MNSQWVVVFDWDGTLIDSLPVKIQNAGALFAQTFGISGEKVMDAYRRHSGVPRRALFDAICQDVGLPLLDETQYAEMSESFTAMNLKAISRLEPPQDTVITLQWLVAQDIPAFVSTAAAPDEVQFLAKSLGLSPYFKEILGSRKGFTKGGEHIHYICQRYGYQRTMVIFVGDEPNDVRLGKQADTLTAIKLGSHPPQAFSGELEPDYFLNHLRQLIDVLDHNTENFK